MVTVVDTKIVTQKVERQCVVQNTLWVSLKQELTSRVHPNSYASARPQLDNIIWMFNHSMIGDMQTVTLQ